MRHVATSALGSLVAILVMGFASAQAPAPTAAPDPPPSEPGFSGMTPAPGGIALLVTTRTLVTVELSADLAVDGCEVATLGVRNSNSWSVYIPGALVAANHGFPAMLPRTMPFFVRCAGAGTVKALSALPAYG